MIAAATAAHTAHMTVARTLIATVCVLAGVMIWTGLLLLAARSGDATRRAR